MSKFFRPLLSLYGYRYPSILTYMLQACEYRARPYLAWYWRTTDFSRVAIRGNLKWTIPARLITFVLALGMLVQLVAGILLILLWWKFQLVAGWAFGAALIISYPIVWAHLITIPLIFGRLLIIWPKESWQIHNSRRFFANFQGRKIAIAGSYGKTSMKEILQTVLSEGLAVAATPANKNVAISHARFAKKLSGNEDILLLEYGEGKPGDVRKFARNTSPTHAVITGLAPAHLDRYKTVKAAGHDIFSVARFLKGENVYVNGESPEATSFIKESFEKYGREGALGWKAQKIAVDMAGTSFELKKGKRKIALNSQLLGTHHIGPLSLAAALALEFGMGEQQVKDGIAKTAPFEHRMQPYQLNGAWIIDDTYNGNLEGIRAGTELLRDLPAKRKIYVTPGLVGQGKTSPKIHQEIGTLIAAANPDTAVLMRNSATSSIQKGLEAAKFTGNVHIESQPLNFYLNLSHFIAAGDLVMLQNDWPDNYN
jgi:UDP-N-acetylmuramyl pentapeptide synthase